MFSPTLILLARAVHILAGIYWAGAVFITVGSLMRAAPAIGPGLVPVMKQIGQRSGIAALLTLIAGLYLFAALHAQDDSVGAKVLGVGAAAALLAFVVGLAVNKPAGGKLVRLQASPPADAAERQRLVAALQSRIRLGTRLVAALVGISVLCMAVFRYAGALSSG